MAKKFDDRVRAFIQDKEKEIYISCINTPESAFKRNPNVISDLRKG